MKFMYVGEYPPQGYIDMYGARFYPEQPAVVTDEIGVRKLKAHALFVHNEEPSNSSAPTPAAEDQPKRRGRPPRVENA